MIEMFLYGFGIMYTPGPVNLLGLNQGINKQTTKSVGFYAGVGFAMLILFLLYGYTGERIIKKDYILYISLLGSLYITYLAFKIYKSNVNVNEDKGLKAFSFKDGLLMQLLNPKATLATLPIATISYPANDIIGIKILFMSIILAAMAFMAPTSYSIIGNYFSKIIKNEKAIKVFNYVMAGLLLYVAFTIFRDHVYFVWTGVNAY